MSQTENEPFILLGCDAQIDQGIGITIFPTVLPLRMRCAASDASTKG